MNEQSATGRSRDHVRCWLLALLAVIIVLIVGAGAWLYILFRPVPVSRENVSFDVRSGDTLDQVAQQLQASGLIRSAWAFRLYAHFSGGGHDLQAGHYLFRKGLSISEILSALEHGSVVSNNVTVTIPEGFTVQQIAERLAADGVCSVSAFLQTEQHDQFTEPFLQQIGKSPQIKYRLEGYLFPDTYDFDRGEPAHDVIDTMLQDFAQHVNDQVMREIQAEGTTLPVVITEASMVEREAKVPSERPIIASVIDNRLKANMPLQIDATIEYILGHQNIVTDRDLQVQDPYNTYLHTGLPPGPIANPGMASIEAVLHPAHTNYYYYVAKNDGSGEHYFAQSYSQQLHNEALSQENLQKYGTQ